MAESVPFESGTSNRSDAEAMEWYGHVIDYWGEVMTAAKYARGERVLAPEIETKTVSERSRLNETGISSVGCAAVMKAAVRLAAHRTMRCESERVYE